jgi:hypothetical protein
MAAKSGTISDGGSKGKRILMWLAFSVVFSLGPVFINYLVVRDNPKIELFDLLNRGELFMLSAALCADAVGRMWGQKAQTGYFSSICLIGCVYILFACSIEFGMAAKNLDSGGRLSPSATKDSLIYFGVTVLAGLGTLLVEEK